jgi:hypothetical protein
VPPNTFKSKFQEFQMSTTPSTLPAGYTVEPQPPTGYVIEGSPADPSKDPDFLAASPDDQVAYLSSRDADFAKASKADQLSYINHLKTANQPDNQPLQAGEESNDVGNKVIVPKDGEDFTDTIKRAVQLGKARQAAGTEQAVIGKEMATAPKKAAQTLGAAATIGVAGPALLAAPGELGEFAIKHLAGNVLPGLEGEAAKQALMQAIPKAVQFAEAMGKLGIGAGGLGYLIKALTGSHK